MKLIRLTDKMKDIMSANGNCPPFCDTKCGCQGKWGGANDDKLNTLEGNMVSVVMKMFIDEAVKKKVVPLLNYLHLEPFGQVCYAGMPYFFTLGTDGLLRKCNEEDEKIDSFNVVGSILKGKLDIFHEKWSNFVLPYEKSFLDDKCSECKFLPICFGLNCPKTFVERGSRNCPEIFKIANEVLLGKYSLYEDSDEN
ncbi:SPASM domain-containing protein [Acholeplasma sp. OttesenSCG-928-E16]|nr:SPASM domain-containing protein [Acholeplasma sp. OttesenSCG-928-E16]